MKYLALEDVLEIHNKIILTTQGLSGYNQANLGYLDKDKQCLKISKFTITKLWWDI